MSQKPQAVQIYVGPADLAFSLGKTPKLDSEDSEQLGMYEVVLAACRKRGIYPGIHCGEPAYAARMIRMGLRLTTIANDSGLMAKAAREAVAGVWNSWVTSRPQNASLAGGRRGPSPRASARSVNSRA